MDISSHNYFIHVVDCVRLFNIFKKQGVTGSVSRGLILSIILLVCHVRSLDSYGRYKTYVKRVKYIIACWPHDKRTIQISRRPYF